MAVRRADYVAGIDEGLKKIFFCGSDPLGDLCNVLGGMVLGHNGGTELEIHPSFEQKVDAFLDGGKVEIGPINCQGIFLLGVFDIHGNVVQKTFIQKSGQRLGVRSVGIQFDGIAESLDLADEVGEIALQSGFAARDTDTVEDALAFFKVGQDLILADAFGVFYFCDQSCVMAKRATEIARGGEYDAGNLAGIIEESHFLKSVDDHGEKILSGCI